MNCINCGDSRITHPVVPLCARCLLAPVRRQARKIGRLRLREVFGALLHGETLEHRRPKRIR